MKRYEETERYEVLNNDLLNHAELILKNNKLNGFSGFSDFIKFVLISDIHNITSYGF